MAYQRILKPRFYMDHFNWLASRGRSRDTMLGINAESGYDPLNTGYTKYQLANMNPLDFVTFNTLAGTDDDTVSITFDFGIAAMPTNFVSIMNHTLNTAGGKIRVAYSSSAITHANRGTAVAFTEVLNGDVSGDYATPGDDYDTLLVFPTASARYWAVELLDVSDWAADVQVGEVTLGEYYTMPISPDMPTSRDTAFPGVNVREAYGGKRFGFAKWTRLTSGVYSPFRSGVDELTLGGRASFDLSYSYLADTNVFPSDLASLYGSSNFLGDVVNRASMSLIPFIWTGDSTSIIAGDYMFSRFDQNSFATSMPSANVETFSARIVQEF